MNDTITAGESNLTGKCASPEEIDSFVDTLIIETYNIQNSIDIEAYDTNNDHSPLIGKVEVPSYFPMHRGKMT